jgi:hypothetical protein
MSSTSPSTSSAATPSSSGTDLSSQASLRAQQHQVRGLQSYLLSCQPFFEKLLTELLLHQPKDPADFMLKVNNTRQRRVIFKKGRNR